MKVKLKIIRNFINNQLIENLHSWVLSQKNLTLWNKPSYFIGGYRFFDPSNKSWEKDEYGRTLLPIENLIDDFLELRNKIKYSIGIKDEFKNKNSTSFVSILKKGSFVEQHYDSSINGYNHIRANVILNNPEGSSFFVVEGKKHKLNSGDLVSFPANLLKHGTTIHNSDSPRTILSYPFLVD